MTSLGAVGRLDRLGRRYAGLCERVVARLPFGLDRRVPPTFLGFALINGTTFAIDVAIVTLVHGRWGLPLAVAVTVGYAAALSLGFGLNKVLNFRSHAPAGREMVRYVLVVATNFLVLLLGVTTLLAATGVQYQVSRLVAGACEGLFMYVALRWFVFRGETHAAGAGSGRIAA